MVLFEGQDKEGKMSGFTDNYIKVTRPYDSALVNTLQFVSLNCEMYEEVPSLN